MQGLPYGASPFALFFVAEKVGYSARKNPAAFPRSSCGRARRAVFFTLRRSIVNPSVIAAQLTRFSPSTSPHRKGSALHSLFCGGEGGIRTHEPFYRLHDFQSCALDQARRLLQIFGYAARGGFSHLLKLPFSDPLGYYSTQFCLCQHIFSAFCV